jgi:hypothetical protein
MMSSISTWAPTTSFLPISAHGSTLEPLFSIYVHHVVVLAFESMCKSIWFRPIVACRSKILAITYVGIDLASAFFFGFTVYLSYFLYHFS